MWLDVLSIGLDLMTLFDLSGEFPTGMDSLSILDTGTRPARRKTPQQQSPTPYILALGLNIKS